MIRKEAEEVVKSLTDDERMDLIMHIAEDLDLRVTRDGEDITYFLSTIRPMSVRDARRSSKP